MVLSDVRCTLISLVIGHISLVLRLIDGVGVVDGLLRRWGSVLVVEERLVRDIRVGIILVIHSDNNIM